MAYNETCYILLLKSFLKLIFTVDKVARPKLDESLQSH